MTKKVNPEALKWPSNKDKYDREYLRIFGIKCTHCNGTGWIKEHDPEIGALQGVEYYCPYCNGIGYIKKK